MAEAQIPHGYKQTEVGMIPEDWEVAPIGEGLTSATTCRLPHQSICRA